MEIETVSELVDQIADWIGIHGSCEHAEDGVCEFSKKKMDCCRVGFALHLEERIRRSVENEKLIEQINSIKNTP